MTVQSHHTVQDTTRRQPVDGYNERWTEPDKLFPSFELS